MKKIIAFLSAAVIIISLSIPAFATTELEDGVTVVSYTENFFNIDRFINVGESVDISAGNIIFMLSNRKPAKKQLSNDMLKAIPDTSAPGIAKAEFTVYDIDFSIDFIVMNSEQNAKLYKDVTESFWGYKHIDLCTMAGFFAGRDNGEFAINSNITRAEFCQMMYNVYKNDKVLEKKTDVQFTDVAENSWYYTAVNACAQAGIIVGMGDGSFLPDGNISRQDAAIIMTNIIFGKEYVQALDFEKTVEAARLNKIPATDIDDTSDYAKNHVAAALGVIFSGDANGRLTPKNSITRSETAAMMSAYFFEEYQESEPEIPEPQQFLVYLSPSNQIHNKYTGADTTEGRQMQLVADYAKKELEKMGYKVFIADEKTSINDTNPYNKPPVEDGITSRAEDAAAMNADCYVAIHSNAIGATNNGGAKGTWAFYNGEREGSTELARAVYDKVAALTPTAESKNSFQEDISYSKDHGQTPYAEVWRPTMANVLLEVEFHDYAPYAQWIVNNSQQLGIAIAEGIDEYFKSLNPAQQPVNTNPAA